MLKKISIKTADGNRYDFIRSEYNFPFRFEDLNKDWIKVEEEGITRMFYRQNIISIMIEDVERQPLRM